MQFMMELVHGPTTCIAAHNHRDDEIVRSLANIKEIAAGHGARVVGGWAFPVGHRMWYVIEASAAETVATIAQEMKLHTWQTVDIHPVLEHSDFKEVAEVVSSIPIHFSRAQIDRAKKVTQ